MKKLTNFSHIKQEYQLFIFFLTAFFSTLLVNSNKSYILLFLVFGTILFFYFKKNIWETTCLTLLLSLPFENSLREWAFYTSSDNTHGHSFFFGITVKIILSLALLLLTCLNKHKIFLKSQKISKKSICLLIFYLLALITSSFFQNRLTTVSIGLVRLSSSIWFYFIASSYFSQKNKKNVFKYYILSLLVFSTFIGLLQLIGQKPIGRFIELTPGFSLEKGYSTTDGEEQYRASGFISHPVYFGSLMSILIPIIVGSLLESKNERHKPFYILTIILSTVVLLGTLSRSTWINLALTFSLFYFYIQKNHISITHIKLNQKTKKTLFILILLIATIPVSSVIYTRIKSIPDLFDNKDGSAYFRLKLLKQSLKLIRFRPLTGFGLNNFSFENYHRNSSNFAAPPHNTIFIFLTELGIPTTIFFILFLYFSLKPKINIFKTSLTNFSFWVGLLTFIISSQIHPLFNLDPTFDMFMLILGYYSTQHQSQK